MRILFISSDTQVIGGIQQYNRKFINALKDGGDDVALVEIKGSVFTKFIAVMSAVLRSIAWKPRITVCAHVHYGPIGLLLKKLFHREYIVCTHGVDVWDIKSNLQKNGLRGAKVITTVAEFTAEKMIRQIPELKDKIYFLYNPIDGAHFVPREKSQELIARYGLNGKKVIFTIARLSKEEGYKGYDRVIEAMPEVLEKIPNAIYLLGGKGGDAPRVKELIERMGLGKKIVMAGFIPDEEVVAHYNLADVFVMPSKAEGAPAVYVEALACGVPVIAGNQDGSSTPLQGGEVGLLIDPDSIHEIANAIIRVLTGNVDARLLDGDFLRKKTLEKFGIDRFPERIAEVLRRAQK